MQYRKLDENDRANVFDLIDNVLRNLDRKDFFIPYNNQEKRKFFDDKFARHFGAFDGEKLVATNGIFFDKKLLSDYYDLLNINKSAKICELGGFITAEEYSGRGIMTRLSEMQCELAEKMRLDYIVATAHPDNIASNIILQKVGLKLHEMIIADGGYRRNLFLKKIEQ